MQISCAVISIDGLIERTVRRNTVLLVFKSLNCFCFRIDLKDIIGITHQIAVRFVEHHHTELIVSE